MGLWPFFTPGYQFLLCYFFVTHLLSTHRKRVLYHVLVFHTHAIPTLQHAYIHLLAGIHILLAWP